MDKGKKNNRFDLLVEDLIGRFSQIRNFELINESPSAIPKDEIFETLRQDTKAQRRKIKLRGSVPRWFKAKTK
jgi:hypothetical protein